MGRPVVIQWTPAVEHRIKSLMDAQKMTRQQAVAEAIRQLSRKWTPLKKSSLPRPAFTKT